jgi:predicted amidohydrolase
VKIALCQTNSGIDPADNADMLTKMVAAAAQGGAALVFTPEMSGLLDRNRERAKPHLTNEAHDMVLAAMRDAARHHAIPVLLGSLALAGETADGRLVNRSFYIDSGGDVHARYDKLHLFDVRLASGESWRESASYAPGDEAVLVETPSAKIGLSICYDLRFPALYAALSAGGAQLLSIPAAFTVPTGEAHWHVLMRARAIENAAFVVAAAQCGLHRDGRSTYGHSLVVDPWGRILLDMGSEIGVGFADVDLDEVKNARAQIPVLDHRRDIPHRSSL